MIITRRRVLAALVGGVATVAIDPFNVLSNVWAQSEEDPQPMTFCRHVVGRTVRAQLEGHGADIAVCDRCVLLNVGGFTPGLYVVDSAFDLDPQRPGSRVNFRVAPVFRGQGNTLEDVRRDYLSAHGFTCQQTESRLKYLLINGIPCNMMIFKVIQTSDGRRFLTYNTEGKAWTKEEIPADVVAIFLGGCEGFRLGQLERCDVPMTMAKQIGQTGQLKLHGNAFIVLQG